jgi:hypothetical protein
MKGILEYTKDDCLNTIEVDLLNNRKRFEKIALHFDLFYEIENFMNYFLNTYQFLVLHILCVFVLRFLNYWKSISG